MRHVLSETRDAPSLKVKDNNRNTVLHLAVLNNRREVVRWIIDLYSRNLKGDGGYESGESDDENMDSRFESDEHKRYNDRLDSTIYYKLVKDDRYDHVVLNAINSDFETAFSMAVKTRG